MLVPLTLATRVPSARPVLSMGHTLVDVLAVTLDLNVTTISTNATKVRHTSSIILSYALIFFISSIQARLANTVGPASTLLVPTDVTVPRASKAVGAR